MTPLDPARPITGGRPAWKDAPNIVLPSLVLTPHEASTWEVQFMFPSQEKSLAFNWQGGLFDIDQLNAFMAEWWAGPEEAIEAWFDLEPPKGKVWNIAKAPEVSGEIDTTSFGDLGL